jgi:methionine-rich copper-binding protein CopC
MFHLSRLIITATFIAGLTAPAWAHAHLQGSMPIAGSTIQVSPGKISVHFTEGLEPSFSGISLSNNEGVTVALSEAVVGGTNGDELSATLAAPLAPGSYRVEWHALSKDGHKTDGNYGFTVAP